jgi:hypothetical protein
MNLFDPQIHLKLGYRVESAFFGLSSCDNRRYATPGFCDGISDRPIRAAHARRQVLRSSGDQ